MKKNITLQLASTLIFLLMINFRTYAQSCQPGFSYTGPNANGYVEFQDTSWSQDTILSYSWQFGDGNSNGGSSVGHTYMASGVYTVCLLIQSASCTQSVCQNINVTVGNPCNMSGGIYLIGPPPQNTLSADIVGGTPPYTYNWITGDTGQVITVFSAGTYCVDVTDATGCVFSTCYAYNNSCNFISTIVEDSISNTLSAIATLGTPPYVYSWSNGSTQDVIYPLTAGNYCVTITDNQGCVTTSCYNYSPVGCSNVFTYSQITPGDYLFVSTAAPTDQTIWDFGDGSPVDTIIGNQITHTYISSMTYMVCLSVIGCNPFCAPIYAQGNPNSVICGTVFNDANENSIIDSLETGLGGMYMFLYGPGTQMTLYSDSITGNFSANVPAGTYTVQLCPTGGGILQNGIITVPVQGPIVPPTSCASYSVTIGSNETICGFNFGIFLNASTVSGTLFYDINSNGVLDGSETGIPYQSIQVGSYMAYTDANGFYSISLPIGNYVVSYTPSGFYSAGTVTTTSVVANVTQNGQIYGNNNVGLYMTPGQVDLSITIHPSTTVTPGFGAWYSINVCNNGTTPTAANVMMQYDSVLTPNYQSPSANLVNTSNHLITWNLPSINPGSCAYIWVTFNALVGSTLGSNTLELVSVLPASGVDNNISNNTDTIHQIVVGSWDPNSKVVDYTNTIDPNYQMVSSTTPNQEIRYTINFQNTGNAPAHNVVVEDIMSSNLDVNSYQFVGASHICQVIRNGNASTYKFMNIMLPDSVNNEPQSHGFITYKINALSSLNIGEQMIDHANIYFDFNAPVLTEDAVVTVVGPTSATSLISNQDFNIYPNPASDFVSINVLAEGDETISLSIIDATGKLCLQQQRSVKAGYNKLLLNTIELSKGIYFVQSTSNDGKVKTSKLNIQ
jgi:uncharacterized repeat protein (TIGR01451 family)